MRIGYEELDEPLREGGLDRAAREMAMSVSALGHQVERRQDGRLADVKAYELVHSHGCWSFAHWKSARACKRAGIPLVVSPHGMLEPWALRHKAWKKLPYLAFFERSRLANASCLLATGDLEARQLAKLSPRARVETIPLGCQTTPGPAQVSMPIEGASKTQTVDLLYLSRVHPKKGLYELIEAIEEALLEFDERPVRLVVVGDGPEDYVKRCRRRAEQIKAECFSHHWVGAVWGEEKWTYLQAADLLCLPSHSENFGMVVLEALQVGTRVMTGEMMPWHHLQRDGYGWTVEPHPNAIRKALNHFCQQPPWRFEQRERLAAWTQQEYGWSNLAKRYERMYKQASE